MGWLAPPEFLLALTLVVSWVVGSVLLIARIVRKHRRATRESVDACVPWKKRQLFGLLLLTVSLLVAYTLAFVVLMLSPPWAQLSRFILGGDWRS